MSRTLVIALVAVLLAACSDKHAGQVQITTVDAASAKAPSPTQGIVIKDGEDVLALTASGEEDVSVEKLALQVKQERFLISRPGETIRLYSDWSGIPVEELKLVNDDKLPAFGQKYILSLTAAEFSDFERKREDYWTGKKKEMYDRYDIKPAEYIVKKNDTLDGIARKFEVPLWFLVMHNEACDPYKLSPGTRLVIPKLEEKKSAAQAAPTDGQITEEDAREVFPVIVKKGETVGEYAKWGQVSVEDIRRANRNLKDFDHIRVGDTINLPLTAKQFRRFQELRKAGETH